MRQIASANLFTILTGGDPMEISGPWVLAVSSIRRQVKPNVAVVEAGAKRILTSCRPEHGCVSCGLTPTI